MEKILTGKKPYLIIAVISFLVYFQSLFFGFTYLDDNVLILDNLYFLKDPANLLKTFTQEVFHILHASASYYRPVLTISFMIDSWFSGSNPFFYHFSSVIIHVINSLLVFVFFKKLNYKESLSFIFALIFAVHPVLSQAVSWVPGRNDTLLFLFVLPAFIFLMDFINARKMKYFVWHLIFLTLSIYTKESAVFMPFLVFFYIYISKGQKVLIRMFGLLLSSYFVIFVIWFFLRTVALGNSPVNYGLGNSLGAIMKNSPAVLLFLGKVFFPVNLTVLPTLQDSTLIFGIISLIVIVGLLIISKNKNWPLLIFGIGWFFIFLITSFVRPVNAYVPDFIEHRLYLPFVGLLMIIAEITWLKKLNTNKKAVWLGILIVILLLMVVNLIHSRVFVSRLAFWKDGVAHSPSHPLTHKNLGAMYYLDGDMENARIEFEKAVQINPNEQMIYNNLGLIYFNRKDLNKAEEYYKKELEINPNYDNTFFNWGLLLWQRGEKDKAAELWEKAVAVNPDHRAALKSLAIYYTDKKDTLKANYYYNEAVKRGETF